MTILDPRSIASSFDDHPFTGQTLRSRLQGHTRCAHERLDRSLRDAFECVAGYASFLQGTQWALAAAGPAFVQFDVISEADLEERFARLRSDLASLDAGPVATPALYVPDNRAHAYGAAYVVEGSALGGRVIARIVERGLGLPASSRRYVELYGNETAARFQAFVARLEEWGNGVRGEERAAALDGASAMFESFGVAFAAAGLVAEDSP